MFNGFAGECSIMYFKTASPTCQACKKKQIKAQKQKPKSKGCNNKTAIGMGVHREKW